MHEANVGRPFIGDTGREFNETYLYLAGLSRPEIRITNTVKCRLGSNNNKPTKEQVEHCASHWIPKEVERCQPSVIVLMGATACSLVPKIELDKDHGIPLWVGEEDSKFLGDWEGWVVPMYHPASGLHDTSQMIPLIEDFTRLGKWMRGKWEHPSPNQDTDYQEITCERELLDDLCLCESTYRYLPMDTEDDGPRPWSLQYSLQPGHGRLIRAERKDLLKEFEEIVEGWDGLLLQYATHDQDAFDCMGLYKLARMPVNDTMQQACHLGNLPQGLKALAWRLLGSRMRSWEDVVMPHSKAVMLSWLIEQWSDAADHPKLEQIYYKKPWRVTPKTKVRDGAFYDDQGMLMGYWDRKATKLERDLKRIMSHFDSLTYDVWEKVAEIGLEGYPGKSIAHVPIDEAVRYACQDADMTGQVGLVLEKVRGEIVKGEWNVDEEDQDQ